MPVCKVWEIKYWQLRLQHYGISTIYYLNSSFDQAISMNPIAT